MKVDILGVFITISGLIFFAISLTIIFLGKKVGGEEEQQKIKIGKYVDLKTNSVLALIFITASFSLTPLVLTYYKPDLSNYISKKDLSEKYLPKDELKFQITGAMCFDNELPADDVKIDVMNSTGEPVTVKIDQEPGYYDIVIDKINPEQDYTVTWSKEGYTEKNFRFRFNFIRSEINLNKKLRGDQ